MKNKIVKLKNKKFELVIEIDSSFSGRVKEVKNIIENKYDPTKYERKYLDRKVELPLGLFRWETAEDLNIDPEDLKVFIW